MTMIKPTALLLYGLIINADRHILEPAKQFIFSLAELFI